MALVAVTFLTMTFISIDKYLAIYLHLRYCEVVTERRGKFLLVAIWTMGGAILLFFLLTLISLIRLYWLHKPFPSQLRLKHHQAQIQDQLQVQGQQLNMAKSRKSAINSMLLLLAFLLCYLAVMISLATFIANSKLSSLKAITLSFMLVYLNSSLNPLVYCWRHRKIRTTARQILAKAFCCGNYP